MGDLHFERVINPFVRGHLMTVPDSSPRAFAGMGTNPTKAGGPEAMPSGVLCGIFPLEHM
jgi:hypothetical protein